MAEFDIKRAEAALIAADNAGDTEAAKQLAQAIRNAQVSAPELNPLEQGLRKAEFASRGFTDSALETIGGLPDLIAAGLRKIGVPDSLVPQDPAFYTNLLKEGASEVGKFVSAPANALLPDVMSGPQTTADRAAVGVGRGLADAGSVLVPAAAASRLAKAGGLTQRVGQSVSANPALQAAAGASGGAVGEATDSPVLGLMAAMAVPGGKGAVSGIKQLIRNASARKGVVKNAPSTQELKDAAKGALKDAEKTGVVVRSDVGVKIADDLDALAAKEGVAKGLTDKVFSALAAVRTRVGKDLDVEDLMIMRKQLGLAAGSPDPNEARIALKLQDKLDDLIDGTLTKKLRKFRGLWAKYKKSQTIEEIFERAQDQASGVENGIRIGFRQLLKNKKRLRGFNKGEVEAMRRVVRGTATSNILKKLSRLSFGSGQQSGFVGGSIGVGAGATLFGPAGAIAAPLIGKGAQIGAEATTKKAGELVRALVASGAQLPKGQVVLPKGPLAGVLAGRGKNEAARPLRIHIPYPRR
jgi:hypothetical protein